MAAYGSFTAGQVLTAAELNGSWVSFTPTWTNLTVGNATQTFRYLYCPGGMIVEGVFNWGSTTSGSGSIQFTLPDSASMTGRTEGSGTAFDGSRLWLIVPYRVSSTVLGFAHTESGNNGILSNTAPFTFGTGDNLQFGVFCPL